jgi:molybdopterin converting factor small subunit
LFHAHAAGEVAPGCHLDKEPGRIAFVFHEYILTSLPQGSMIRIIRRFPGSNSRPEGFLLLRQVCYNRGMNVKIKLFASLRKFGPDEQTVALPEDATVDDAVHFLNLPHMALLKIVNGEHRPANYPLKDGDELALFPPIAGG